MKITIDILHYPHMNFFKHAVFHFLKMGVDIDLIVQPRGNLEKILQYEYGLPYTILGSYEKSKLKKILNYVSRDFLLYQYLCKSSFDVATSVGSINLAHAAFLLRKPSIIFEDDVEFGLAFYPYKFFATHIVVPRCLQVKGSNVLRYKGFKELAYLHPNHFTPSSAVLSEYNLKPNQYIFIREVSSSSLNYRNLDEGYLSNVCPYLKDLGFDIVLSLENPLLKEKYSKLCTILQEPISDVHSLLYNAAFTIASGDSMARESVLLRTPAIYTGNREMVINSELIKKGCFFKKTNMDGILKCIKYIVDNNIKKETYDIISKAIQYEWVDTTEVKINVISSELFDDPTFIIDYSEK